jgi:hypothetical protein
MGTVKIARDSSVSERKALIVSRYAARVPLRLIADEVGLTPGRVSQIYKDACQEIPAEALHTIRVDSTELFNRALSDLLKIAENPQISPRTRVEAWTSIRSWDESHRKLMGADAPTRREITVISNETVDNAILELNKEMAQLAAQAEAAGHKLPTFA